MLSKGVARKLLDPFEVSLSDDSIENLLQYLSLLVRWNEKINLTSVRAPEECVTRHFGESFYLERVVPLKGRLLDIGSGAGFPGLAIKLIAPELEVVLLEPAAKKRAFLKEAARICRLSSVRVLGSRIDDFARQQGSLPFDLVTARAVGGLQSLIPAAAAMLNPGGHICLWIGSQQSNEIRKAHPSLHWRKPVLIPLSRGREILAARI